MEVCLTGDVAQFLLKMASCSRLLRIKRSGNSSDEADRCGVRKA